jgi:small subunit ribosomal protein S17
VVISDSMDKTVVVKVERTARHPMYGKTLRRVSKIYAHDSSGEAKAGDRVMVMETRPISKTKRWRVVEVVEKAK